ncbi:bifunctional ornithine acetyltransferase/N-acetylglutamate synthase, partial [Modestobacter sp. KNN46-3]|uniref:bifunctional ornithine acetyltransferase/N-acetylglutamate synthase n=1 Tax=Modestobacter sp. KNN46-3 TaxID=2711218 RepID=UPI00240720B3
GANACTGPEGFADTHTTAEHVAAELGIAAVDVAVPSTGLIGVGSCAGLSLLVGSLVMSSRPSSRGRRRGTGRWSRSWPARCRPAGRRRS